VKEHLSAYYDDELAPDKRSAVADHLANCESCVRMLEEYRELSALSAALTHPTPPHNSWQQLEVKLAVEEGKCSTRLTYVDWLSWARRPLLRLAIATAATIVLGAGWIAYHSGSEYVGHRKMAAVFEEYLERFPHDPMAAQQFLLVNFEGKVLDAMRAIPEVGYRPAIADGVPDGYTIESTYVIKMPCCSCVKCLCKRSDGTTLAIFEHSQEGEEEANWFGNRRKTRANCNGTPCNLIQLNDRMAASWKRGQRYVTAIGVRDAAEVDQLVAWFNMSQDTHRE